MALLRKLYARWLWRVAWPFRRWWEPPVFARHLDVYTILEAAWLARGLYVAAELGIADLLRDGPKKTEDLARLAGAHAPYLYRVLRALAGFGFFYEGPRGTWRLTRAAEALRSDAAFSMRDWTLLLGRGTWYLACFILETVRTGKRTTELAHGKRTVWEVYEQDPRICANFVNGMANFTKWQAPLIAAAYDFGRFGTICDVGGGRGILLGEILRRYPRLRGVLFDLPNTIALARRDLEAAGVLDRCQTVGGDFFQSVLPRAEAYLLKHVLHDWEDPDALRILRSIRNSMDDHAVVLSIHALLDPANGVDRLNKLVDLEYLLIGSQLRTLDEFRDLFRQAGLEVAGVHPTPVLDATILEARKV